MSRPRSTWMSTTATIAVDCQLLVVSEADNKTKFVAFDACIKMSSSNVNESYLLSCSLERSLLRWRMANGRGLHRIGRHCRRRSCSCRRHCRLSTCRSTDVLSLVVIVVIVIVVVVVVWRPAARVLSRAQLFGERHIGHRRGREALRVGLLGRRRFRLAIGLPVVGRRRRDGCRRRGALERRVRVNDQASRSQLGRRHLPLVLLDRFALVVLVGLLVACLSRRSLALVRARVRVVDNHFLVVVDVAFFFAGLVSIAINSVAVVVVVVVIRRRR